MSLDDKFTRAKGVLASAREHLPVTLTSGYSWRRRSRPRPRGVDDRLWWALIQLAIGEHPNTIVGLLGKDNQDPYPVELPLQVESLRFNICALLHSLQIKPDNPRLQGMGINPWFSETDLPSSGMALYVVQVTCARFDIDIPIELKGAPSLIR